MLSLSFKSAYLRSPTGRAAMRLLVKVESGWVEVYQFCTSQSARTLVPEVRTDRWAPNGPSVLPAIGIHLQRIPSDAARGALVARGRAEAATARLRSKDQSPRRRCRIRVAVRPEAAYGYAGAPQPSAHPIARAPPASQRNSQGSAGRPQKGCSAHSSSRRAVALRACS